MYMHEVCKVPTDIIYYYPFIGLYPSIALHTSPPTIRGYCYNCVHAKSYTYNYNTIIPCRYIHGETQ